METLGRILFFVLLFCLPAKANWAQSFRFTDNTNKWLYHYIYSPGGATNYRYYWAYSYSDSIAILNGYEYKVLRVNSGGNSFDQALVREDTLQKKIFMRILQQFIGQAMQMRVTSSEEFVFMDYNLRIGDTLKIPIISYVPPPMLATDTLGIFVVTDIDSILADNVYHKRWKFSTLAGMYYPGLPPIFIEGLGSLSDILFTSSPSGSRTFGQLDCFETNGMNPFDAYSDCSNFPTSIHRNNNLDNIISIFPNPAKGLVKIAANTTMYEKSEINITDLQGRTMYFNNLPMPCSIDVSKFPSGMYFVTIAIENNLLHVKKLIVVE